MYKYHPPKPIIIDLNDGAGFLLREKASQYIEKNRNKTGAERGSKEQQGFGALAEIVLRNQLGMPEINPPDHPLGYDILLPSGVKLDVKCRGGEKPFVETYESDDGIGREAKHNLFARQLHDEKLDTEIYLMTHLETPSNRELPGTPRQRKWKLYVCGWVSKERAINEGVFLPRGSLTEQGRTWFTYRGQEVEFYNRNLNGLADISELNNLDREDVDRDGKKKGDLNLTSVDAIRIAYDLVGRGVLNNEHLHFIEQETGIEKSVKPILHPNQYFHLLMWLQEKGKITDAEFNRAKILLQEEIYSEI